MPNKNLLEILPIDLTQHVSSFLEYKSIANASKASKICHRLFNNDSIWKYQLKKEFGIENDQLSQFEKKFKAKLNYKQLFARFHYLSQQCNLTKLIKTIYRDKTQHDLILLACSDNMTYLKSIPREQQYIIAVLAIYAGCLNIQYSFLERHKNKNLLKNFLYHASRSGNLQLVQYLLNSKNKFELTPDKETLNDGASSGSLQLVQYLLDSENRFGLKPTQFTLYYAAGSSNLQLVQYLLNPDNKFGLHSNQSSLNFAARSGNIKLVQYLLNPKNEFALKPNQSTLNFAAESGNLQLMQYLLNPDNTFELTPDKNTLDAAVKSGNLQLVQYLLNPENKLELTPDKNTLDAAARSGNIKLVQYLLNAKNKFALNPNQSTLNFAADSGNLQLVQYLLNSENRFGLTPDDNLLNCAVGSGNLHLVQCLLNPHNQFGFEITQKIFDYIDVTTNVTTNFALSEYLLPSHRAFQDALKKLQAHDFSEAKKLFQQSRTACPSHYNMMLHYIVNNPQRFNLHESAMQYVEEHADTLFEDEKMSTEVSLNF